MGRNLSIIVFAALLIIVVYEAGLRVARPRVDAGQDQFATNVIRLENYVDRGERAAGVLVGSSLTARVPEDAWPEGWQVLSQAGGDALTGLEVISRTNPLPARVLIEINTIDSDGDEAAVTGATGRLQRWIRRVLWLTRTANRPANLLVWKFRALGGSNGEHASSSFARLLGERQRSYAVGPDDRIAKSLVRIKRIVDQLRRNGVEVGFFEFPVDKSLVQTMRTQSIRTLSHRAFPPSVYCWLTVDDGQTWRTIDGIHLLPIDARRAMKILTNAPCQYWDRR